MTTVVADTGFEDLVAPLRRELLAHCYRMSGSAVDAEDLLQETLVRAWRGRSGYRGDASLRTWLHRIATNVCLTFLEGRPRRPVPTGLGAPDSDPSDELVENREIPCLQPLPTPDPADEAVDWETLSLAFVAAIQLLPERQRAALVLKDCLAWSAAEIAEAVGASTATVNSLVQRAKSTLDAARTDGRVGGTGGGADPVTGRVRTDPMTTDLAARYVAAFESHDGSAIAALFTDDAVWQMPPFTGWYVGPERIARLALTRCPAEAPGDLALVPLSANGGPAFGVYLRQADGRHHPFQVHVLDPAPGGTAVGHAVSFTEPAILELFGMTEPLDRQAGGCSPEATAGSIHTTSQV